MTSHEYYRTLDALDEALSHLREGYLDSDEKEGKALEIIMKPLSELRGMLEKVQVHYGQV